jgi:hypothetical protein
MRSLQTIASLPAAAVSLNSHCKYLSRLLYVFKVRGDAKPAALAGRLDGPDIGQQRALI